MLQRADHRHLRHRRHQSDDAQDAHKTEGDRLKDGHLVAIVAVTDHQVHADALEGNILFIFTLLWWANTDDIDEINFDPSAKCRQWPTCSGRNPFLSHIVCVCGGGGGGLYLVSALVCVRTCLWRSLQIVCQYHSYLEVFHMYYSSA